MPAVVGHAVRMIYCTAGVPDVYSETGDAGYLQGLETSLTVYRVALEQPTRYPWDGEVTLRVQIEATFFLKLRIPAWTEVSTVSVNGETVKGVEASSYASLEQSIARGDTGQLSLPMPVRYMEAHPHVTENIGRNALARGPILY